MGELQSELQWMAHLNANGLGTPEPLASIDGSYCHEINGTIVDVLEWLEGETLTERLCSAHPDKLVATFCELGRSLAELHVICDKWAVPSGFTRPDWNVEGLVGEAPVWNRFWENPLLSPELRRELANARAAAGNTLSKIAPQLDHGLIHADVIPDNVLVAGDRIHLIDFDDGGYGFRLFDLATTLNKIPASANQGRYEAAFLDGYLAIGDMDLTWLPLFRALRCFTYIGWIMTRMDQPGSAARLEKFILAARPHLDCFEELTR